MRRSLLLVTAFISLILPFKTMPAETRKSGETPYLITVAVEEKLQYMKDCAREWTPKQWKPECYRHTVLRATGNAEKDIKSLLQKYSYAVKEEICALNPGLCGRPFRRYEKIIVPYVFLQDQLKELLQEKIAKMSGELAASEEENSALSNELVASKASNKDLNARNVQILADTAALSFEKSQLENRLNVLTDKYNLTALKLMRVHQESRNLARVIDLECKEEKEKIGKINNALGMQVTDLGKQLEIQTEQATHFMNRAEEEVARTTEAKQKVQRLAEEMRKIETAIQTLEAKLANPAKICQDPALMKTQQ